MENNSSIYSRLLKENIAVVNNLISKILWGVLGILIVFYFIAQTEILRIDGSFIIKWFLVILGLNIIYLILEKIKVSDNVKKYYLITAMQIAVIFGATDVRIGYHILYVIVPVASCIYFDKRLTLVISSIALVLMNMCIVYVSGDRVANGNSTYTREHYITAYGIGYSTEFIALVLVLWFLTTRIMQVMFNLAEKNRNIVEMQQKIICSFAGLIESRDDDTGHHVKRTEKFVEVTIDALTELKIYENEMKELDVDMVSRAAQLHDIGKLKISDNILCKPGKLTAEEYDIVKEHTLEGKEIIEKYLQGVEEIEFIDEAKNIALSHHERWDGQGYPNGLKKNEIPISARIMAVADVFDALVSKRCYKDAISLEEAFLIIEQGSGTQFDPEIVNAFLTKKDKIREIYEEQHPSN